MAILQKLLTAHCRKLNGSRLYCPFTQIGLCELQRLAGPERYGVLADEFEWPPDPSSAQPSCVRAPCHAKPFASIAALLQHAEKQAGVLDAHGECSVRNDSDESDESDSAADRVAVYKALVLALRPVAPAPVVPQQGTMATETFVDPMPWPPVLHLYGLDAEQSDSKRKLEQRFAEHGVSKGVAMYGHKARFTGQALLCFHDERDKTHVDAFKRAKLFKENLSSDKRCVGIQARWLTEQKYNELKKPTWAKDLIRWGESQGLHWVNRPDKERELQEAEKLRNEEMARVVHQTQEQKSRLEEQLRKREAELEQKAKAIEEENKKQQAQDEHHKAEMRKLQLRFAEISTDKVLAEERARTLENNYRNKVSEMEAMEEGHNLEIANAAKQIEKKRAEIDALREQTQSFHVDQIKEAEEDKKKLEENLSQARREMEESIRKKQEEIEEAQEEALSNMSKYMKLVWDDQDNKEMIKKMENLIKKLLGANDKRIRTFGELDANTLMELGLKVDSRRKLSRSDMDLCKFYEVFSEMSAAMFERPISENKKKVMFIPQDIFKVGGEAGYILKPCNATHPKTGSKADPQMDPWVAMLRSTYTEKEANDVLEYLLEKYREARSQIEDDAGKAPRKLWNYTSTAQHPNGREMKPVEKFDLLMELLEGNHIEKGSR